MTPHFHFREIQCRCGCGGLPKQDFMDKVEKLRDRLGFALPCTSGYRCPEYNSRVSGTGRTGPHTTGRAIDLSVSHARALELLRMALSMGFTGIGIKQHGAGRFIHLDDLPEKEGQFRPTIWSY
jgi:zinc D-Ala-D-Ala carboxypeptidase